jgi:hypothetical protein
MTETAAGPAQKIDEEPAIQLVEEEPPVQMQEQELVAKKPARRMSMLDLVADDSEDFIPEEVQPADTLAGTDIISPYQSQSSDHTTTDTLVGAISSARINLCHPTTLQLIRLLRPKSLNRL